MNETSSPGSDNPIDTLQVSEKNKTVTDFSGSFELCMAYPLVGIQEVSIHRHVPMVARPRDCVAFAIIH